MSAPRPVAPAIMESQEVREWWRWHFAGLVLGHLRPSGDVVHPDTETTLARRAIERADALIAALEAKP